MVRNKFQEGAHDVEFGKLLFDSDNEEANDSHMATLKPKPY